MKKSTLSLVCTFLLLALLVFPAGTQQSSSTSDKNSLTDCATDSVTTNPCVVNSSGKLVTNTFGSDITSWNNTGGSTTVSATIPNGFYINKNIEFTDSNLLAANILTGVSIFGVTGNSSGAGSFSSNALRDPSVIPIARHLDVQSTSTAITLSAETTTYAGTDLPSGFREIPDQIKDDEGYMGISCKYAPVPL